MPEPDPTPDPFNPLAVGPPEPAPIGRELRETRVQVPDEVFQRLGVPKGNVFADYGHLARKHPEYLANSQAAKDFVEHVMAAPTDILPGNMPDHRMIVRINGGNKAVALEVELRGGKYRVKSAYVMTDAQLMRGRNAAGPGAKPAIPYVNPSQETSSGLLDAPRDAPPDGGIQDSRSAGQVNDSAGPGEKRPEMI